MTIIQFPQNNAVYKVVLYQDDSLFRVPRLKPGSASLIITSPPYNLEKEYETKVDLQTYLGEQKKMIALLYDVLPHNGSICWQVGNYVKDGEVFPLDIYYYDIFRELGYKFQKRIIWTFGHGLHCKKRFSGRHETIMWFTKSDDFTFNLDNLGHLPTDVQETLQRDWETLVWDIPNVKSSHPEKSDHPCQFPVELAERLLLVLSNEGDTVLDIYGGSGQTAIASIKNNRNAVYIDMKNEYCQDAKERLILLKKGELKTRSMTRKIFNPLIQ